MKDPILGSEARSVLIVQEVDFQLVVTSEKNGRCW
jgi:hypothetical protein